MKKDILVIGGGAAGFFAALACAEQNPDWQITILEKSSRLLQKVKISGGGRCNVTHACFEPKEFIKHFPRGEKQLLGPLTRFNPTHTIDWFERHGVELKREEDGRMFPVSDSSQTIIDCFLTETKRIGVEIKMQSGLEQLIKNQKWLAQISTGESIEADAVIFTTGSSLQIWNLLERLGHKIIPPVPSLFTFNIKDERIRGLEGLSLEQATVSVLPIPNTLLKLRETEAHLTTTGPVLITHWGMSGPAILRLSAWGARALAAADHQFEINVNWIDKETVEVAEAMKQFRQKHSKKLVIANPLFNIPKRLWERLAAFAGITDKLNFADLTNKQIDTLAAGLTGSKFHVSGKSTFKDEFVTAGGVDLDEVDFKTMQSKKFPGLFFAGEVLDIDAITGGFNFQSAWTTGWIAGNSVGKAP